MKKSVKGKKVKAESVYRVTFKLGKEVYEGKGETLYEALTNLPKPIKIMTKSFLYMEKGDKTVERMFMPTQARRLFFPLAQLQIAKQLDFLLK